MSDMNTALELQPPAPLANFTEQSASMMTQLATAQIQSRYAIAIRFPRNIDQVRQDMLKECSRPSFCMPDESKNGSSVAIYRVPRGRVQNSEGKWVQNNIEGVSIRFAEMCLRAYKNLNIDVVPLGEDEKQRLYQVNCTDYESNNTTSEIVSVPKTVERKKAKPDDQIISRRTNSYGDEVFIVQATEEELMMKRNALISKARRNLIMQNIPGWLVEECVHRIRETARKKDAEDPDAAKKKLFDAFASIGVSAEMLNEYIGHTNALSPAELEDLRGYYSGIREGVTTWKEVVAAKDEGTDEEQAKHLEGLFERLQYTTGQIRNVKAKYVGHPDKLLAYLEGLVAKQGAPAAQQKQAEPAAKEEDTVASSATPTSQTKQPAGGAFATGTGVSQQEPPKPAAAQKTPPATKKPAPAANTSGW